MIRKVAPSLMAQQIVGVQPMTNIGSIFDRAIGGHSFNEKYWPHVKMVSWKEIFDAERFCYTNFKSRNWRNAGQFFAFKRKRDYEWFLLRWP
jgi:hypothetical protein